MPRGLIIKARECSAFWGGDEHVSYQAPPGWKAVYPSGGGKITFDNKECRLRLGNEKDCCQELGFDYVDIKPKTGCGPAASWFKCLFM